MRRRHTSSPRRGTPADLAAALRTGPFHLALRSRARRTAASPCTAYSTSSRASGVKVGVTSLSYWQQGARRPQRTESLRAVRALEEILRAARGSP